MHPVSCCCIPTRYCLFPSLPSLRGRLQSEVEPLKELLRTPAPAITIKSVDKIVLEQRESEDFAFLQYMDLKGAEELSPDAFDGYYNGKEFVNLLNADVDIAFQPAETTISPQTFLLDEEGDSQAADFDEYAEGSQAAYLATQEVAQTPEDDAVLDDGAPTSNGGFKKAARKVIAVKRFSSSTSSQGSDGLASLMASSSVGSEVKITCKVVAGQWADTFDVTVAPGVKFSDLYTKLIPDIGHEDIAKLTCNDFTCLEDQKILDPRNNPERPSTVKKDNSGGEHTIYKHQMRGVVSNMADFENQMIFCIKKASLQEMLRNEREAAPPSFEAAVKGDGPVDGAAAKRTASA